MHQSQWSEDNRLSGMIAQYDAAKFLETDMAAIVTYICKYNLTLLVVLWSM